MKRLESLDVLRGFDMFFIFLPDPVPCIVVTFLALFGLEHSSFALQFEHCAWDGLRFYDCIFPLFLFISGVTFPFSYASQVSKGMGARQVVLKILKRMAILFLMGCMLWTVIDGKLEKNILSFDWSNFRVWSVIGRIGIAWGIAALLYVFCSRRTRIAVAVLILLGMWMLLRFAVAPGAPEGINPLEHPQWIWANWFGKEYLTTRHVGGEGAVSTVTMVVTAMLGNFAGEILRSARLTMERKVLSLAIFALWLSGVGLLVAEGFGEYSLPVNKPLWTSSYTLVAGGISVGLLALFYWIIDVKGYRRWGFFFKVIGMNAITLYILVRTIFNWQFLSVYFFGGIASLLPPVWGAFVTQAGMIALGWSALYWLYRRNIFLRV